MAKNSPESRGGKPAINLRMQVKGEYKQVATLWANEDGTLGFSIPKEDNKYSSVALAEKLGEDKVFAFLAKGWKLVQDDDF